jgi:uncharacterized membrane protein HdeD (DUF308 family)
MHMQRIESVLERAIPWHENAFWPAVFIEGVLAAALGVWIVAHPGNTESLIIRLIGVYLLVSGVLGLVSDVRRLRDGLDMRFTAARHVGMAVVGAIALADPTIPRVIAWCCVLLGLVGLVLAFGVKDLGPARWGVLTLSALTLAFGVLLLWALATGTFLVAIFGLAVIVVGCLLVLRAVSMVRGAATRQTVRA